MDGLGFPLVPLAVDVGPRLVDRDRLVEGDTPDLRGQTANHRGIDAGLRGDGLRRVSGVEVLFRQQLERRDGEAPFPDLVAPRKRRARAFGCGRDGAFGHGFPDERRAVGIAREKPVLGGSRRIDDQPGGVGVADEVVDVDAPRLQQFVDDGEDQQPVRPRADADPVVGHRRIAGAHRIDRYEPGAALLDLGDADLDRVGIMVFGDAEHDEEFRPVPVRRAELPERAADGHDAGGRHVDRAEAAMGGIVRRAELLGPESGQRLRLVAPGEEGELLRIGLAHRAEPLGRQRQRLVPGDLAELARAARPGPQQRRAQPRRGVVLHDTRRPLGA